MADCLTLLLQGSVLTGLTCTWTNIIGFWFYALVLAAFEVSIAIKFENITAPAVIGLFISILMINYFPPEVKLLPILIFIINAAAIIYKRVLDEPNG